MAESGQVAESMARRYAVLRPHLDERQRRLGLTPTAWATAPIRTPAQPPGTKRELPRGVQHRVAQALARLSLDAPLGFDVVGRV